MVFQSWSWKKRGEDHDSDQEYLDSWSESCFCCNLRREDTALQGWRKKRRRDDDDDGQSKRKEEETRFRHRTDDLPLINDDLLEEIMLRLPAKALNRFEIVSKHWSRRIKSKYFKDRYMSHQKTTQEPKFLCLHESFLGLTLTSMSLDWSSTSCLAEEGPVYHIEPKIDQSTRVSGSCEGLVCIFDEHKPTSPIIVTNPAMVRAQTLPLSWFQRQCLEDNNNKKNQPPQFPGLGKDDVTGTYKLVWLHNNESNYTLSCEVFDFEVKKWRYLANTPCDVRANEEPIFAKGWLYWIIANRSNEYNILGYNIHTEMFRVFTNTIVSEACDFNTITMCSLSDRIWVTNNMPEGDGMQHFWRIKNTMDSEWESEKLFSIDPYLISPGFKNTSTVEPFITLKATSKDNKKVIVSRLYFSNLVHLLSSPTGQGLVFGSAFTGPGYCTFIPYFQSLDFPL